MDYTDSNTYALSVCNGTALEWTRDGSDTCFPKWVRRTCGEDEWKFYDDDDNLVPVESLPLCGLCVEDCNIHDPFPCVSVDPCDLTLTCCSSGEANTGSPPSPYTSCTHDDGDPVGGTGHCFCAAGGCYSYDYKGWLPICAFAENGGTCLGDGTEEQVCITVEVTFDITHHCQSDGEGGCEVVP